MKTNTALMCFKDFYELRDLRLDAYDTDESLQITFQLMSNIYENVSWANICKKPISLPPRAGGSCMTIWPPITHSSLHPTICSPLNSPPLPSPDQSHLPASHWAHSHTALRFGTRGKVVLPIWAHTPPALCCCCLWYHRPHTFSRLHTTWSHDIHT